MSKLSGRDRQARIASAALSRGSARHSRESRGRGRTTDELSRARRRHRSSPCATSRASTRLSRDGLCPDARRRTSPRPCSRRPARFAADVHRAAQPRRRPASARRSTDGVGDHAAGLARGLPGLGARPAGTRCRRPRRYGGQGLPHAAATRPASRCGTSASMAFALCPLLTVGAIEALHAARLGGAEGALSRQARLAASGPAR